MGKEGKGGEGVEWGRERKGGGSRVEKRGREGEVEWEREEGRGK